MFTTSRATKPQPKLIESAARGTSEPGALGQIVGDPLVARVKRDMKEISSQGYPVQVSFIVSEFKPSL